MNGFRQGEIAKIGKDLYNHLRSKSVFLKDFFLEQTQEAIWNGFERDVYESGYLYDNTGSESNNLPDGIRILLYTKNVDYAQYPYYGLGSSRKYGPRPYLEVGAKTALKTITRS